MWQVYSFYNVEYKQASLSNFKQEALMLDLITSSNFNYISIITTIFYVIFASNFSGIIPYTQTITSQLLFTLILSLTSMFLI